MATDSRPRTQSRQRETRYLQQNSVRLEVPAGEQLEVRRDIHEMAMGTLLRWLITGVSKAQERWTRAVPTSGRPRMHQLWRRPSTRYASPVHLARPRRISATPRRRATDD